MLPFLQNARHRYWLVSGLIVSLLVISYYLAGGPIPWRDQPRSGQETEVAKQDSKIKITANTDLVQKIVYTKCGDDEVFRTKPADNLVGLNFSQVQKVYTGWSIDKFDTKEVEMNLKVDSYCREHANNMFVGIQDGHVAVFYGKPGPRAIVKEVTKIPISQLSSEDVEELRQGMVVQSREELLRTLEGMQSR